MIKSFLDGLVAYKYLFIFALTFFGFFLYSIISQVSFDTFATMSKKEYLSCFIIALLIFLHIILCVAMVKMASIKEVTSQLKVAFTYFQKPSLPGPVYSVVALLLWLKVITLALPLFILSVWFLFLIGLTLLKKLELLAKYRDWWLLRHNPGLDACFRTLLLLLFATVLGLLSSLYESTMPDSALKLYSTVFTGTLLFTLLTPFAFVFLYLLRNKEAPSNLPQNVFYK